MMLMLITFLGMSMFDARVATCCAPARVFKPDVFEGFDQFLNGGLKGTRLVSFNMNSSLTRLTISFESSYSQSLQTPIF